MMHILAYSLLAFFSSVYDFTLPSLYGGDIHFSQYQNRKILLVNIATGAPQSTLQLAQLQQFYALHKDSIVVIGILSNSFGNLGGTEQQIKDSLAAYNIQFPVAAAIEVTGSNTHPLYQWLTQASENGVLNSEVKGDFQKYLVNRQGQLTGYFTPAALPFGNDIRAAIAY